MTLEQTIAGIILSALGLFLILVVIETMKPFSLAIDDEFKQAIRDGATHIAVRFVEGPESCRGDVLAVGTYEECGEAFHPTMYVVNVGEEIKNEIWDADVVRPLIDADTVTT